MGLFSNLSSIELFIAFFIPGFIMVKIWEYYVPAARSEWDKRLPEIVGYSCIFYAVSIWPYFLIANSYKPIYEYLDVFILPLIVALAAVHAQKIPLNVKRSVQATPWDQFFQRAGSDEALKNGLIVYVQLKNSEKLVGYYGAKSHASTFPNPPQIYLQQLYSINDDTSVTPVEPATSALIDCSEVAYLAFRIRNF